jgi:hypothetical protein
MGRVKGLKLLSATGVAMAVFLFVPLGSSVVRSVGPTFWNEQVWPRLAPLLRALPVVVAALTSGCLLRRQRPERVAAVVGGIGGLCALVLPWVLMTSRGESATASVLKVVVWWWAQGLPLAVACWLGANYWRSDTGPDLWNGPSGAIVRGGVVAGLLVVPLRIPVAWYHHTLVRGYAAAHALHVPAFHWGIYALGFASAIPAAAAITALLASWRPRPWWGAFAGSGIAAGVAGIGMAFSLSLGTPPSGAREGLLLTTLLYASLYIVMGAIAGSFAGRWEVGSGVEPPPD